jgi:hypothetical protein
MPGLESVSIFRTEITNIDELASSPRLNTLTLVGVPNADRVALEVGRLNSNVTIKTYR